MTRVLVTGASGYIGSHALEVLASRDFEVHALARRAPEGRDVHWHELDLLEPGAPAAIAARVRATHLLHLAWFAEHGSFWSAPVNFDWLRASVELVSAFRREGGERAVIAGTCAEYEWGGGPCDEASTPIAPSTLYGRAKDALRRSVEVCGAATGLRWAWGRLFFSYGPREQPARLVTSIARALIDGHPALATSGEQIRDFMHVADVAGALVAILESDVDGPINVASGEAIAIRDLVARIGELCERGDLVRIGAIEARAGDPASIVANVARLRGEVGFVPRFDLDAGLRDTIAFLRRCATEPRQR